MINQYIEPTIKRKVSVLEAIYANPGITIKQLASELALAPHLAQRVVSELKQDPTLALSEQKGHFQIQQIQTIIDYNTALYRQSPFLSYLLFVLLNQNEDISVVNLSFLLNRSTSSLYDTRKQVQQALNEYGLTLQKNTVQGSELAHRMLIALLKYKYNLSNDEHSSDFTDLLNGDKLLDRLLSQYLQIKFPNNYKLEFYRSLIKIGLERLNYQNQLTEVATVSLFSDTPLATHVHQLIDEYVERLGITTPLLPASYDYFLYVTLIADPLDFDDEIYHRILQLLPYQQIHRRLLAPVFFKNQLSHQSTRSLITYIFTQTFLHRDRFIEKAQFDLTEITTVTLHPVVINWVDQILTQAFSRSISPNLLNELSVQIQSLLFTKLQFKLGILVINMNPAFIDGLRQRMQTVIHHELDIIDLPTITDYSPYRNQYDAIIILASSQSFVALREGCGNLNEPNLKLLPVTNQDLLDLPIRIFNLTWEMKHQQFTHLLDQKLLTNK